ncbi:ethyl tert-butyl ether degradation protein [Diplodia corticola]|uniref:Ethyl tert-butyl ether degradation protein n=1 Tax=Diplodia corticola TaxID=236234 RepID=A0A1J9S6K5_9PEZI|nr:ethyl tert-butyl ether degradation protein [Diplodia corticola]OJD35245.1 ethyl tert-butyl ether degradation protein [Diplodia corticola]
MRLPSTLLLQLASWLPKPGPTPAADVTNQNVIPAAASAASAAAIVEPSPPPPQFSSPPPPPPSTNSTLPSPSPSPNSLPTCPSLSTPLALSTLPSLFSLSLPTSDSTLSPSALTSIAQIKQTLTLYALAIDGRDFSALDRVFAPGASAHYGPPIGRVAGREAIEATLPPLLTVYAGTQHVLGTVGVVLCQGGEREGDGEGEEKEGAVSVAYFTATHFGKQAPREGDEGVGGAAGWEDVVVAWGQYQDRWEKGEEGWRIVHRNLVYMGPFVSGA